MILEGCGRTSRISRSEERGFYAERPKPPEPREQFNRPPAAPVQLSELRSEIAIGTA